MPHDNIEEIIAFILFQNKTFQGCLRDQFDSVHDITTVSRSEPDEQVNLAIFTAEGTMPTDF
jgi:hypothetical protein